MSDKSGVSSQIISLPKGGGALHGLGEKFSPDLHTGTGNFTIPIALPPGRNGFQPDLSLVYSTGHGNGPFGLGWSLSIPGVARQTAKGVPLYDDARDVFVLSGSEDLVLVDGDPHTSARYRPRTEGLFARIEHRFGAGEDFWDVRTKDGLVSRYGPPAAPVDPPAVLANPDRPDQIFAWKLTETCDTFGNRIAYSYGFDEGQQGPHRWKQPLLRRIRYVDFTNQGTTRFLVSVTFEYEERADAFSEYRAGFEIRTTRRCRAIVVRTHADRERLVRTYEPRYEYDPHNGVSLLRRIEVVGYDDAGEESRELPSLEFGYSRFDPERRDLFAVTGPDLPPASLARGDYELVDLFGNGLPDVLEMNGTVRYWRNLGEGRLDRPSAMRDAPAGLQLADPGVQLLDADGDGRADLLVTADGLAGYFPLRFGGVWDRRSFQRYRAAPSFDLEDPEVKLVDLDGDGLTDVVRSGARFECFFNDRDPRKAWSRTRRVERRTLDAFPNVSFADPRVKWADMTGDGLQDIVLVHDGEVEYWPNLGHGSWAGRVRMENSPRFPWGYDPRRILIGDVDGDGLADLVYVEDRKVTLWINRSGSTWGAPIVIQGTPPVSDFDAVRLVDMRGSGVSGVLWSADANGQSRPPIVFLDVTGGRKPYLLDEMDNHLGAVTKVEYAPSTRFYLDDERWPKARWKTPLPFPVQVVARVEVIDEIFRGKLTTEYRYHHGYWDGAEREFRGFGMVEQLDTETFEAYHQPGLHGEEAHFDPVRRAQFSPPTLTKTWFHQGPVGDEHGEWEEPDFSAEFWPEDPPALARPSQMSELLGTLPRRAKRDALRALRGSILRTELYARDGTERQDRPYSVTESLSVLREEMPLGPGEADRLRIFFPHVLAERTTQWERGDDPLTQFTFTDDYDPYGQPLQHTVVSLPRRSAKRTKVTGAVVGTIDVDETRVLATHTRTLHAIPDPLLKRELRDRVAQVRTFELVAPGGVSESAPGDLGRVLQEQATAAAAVHQRFLTLLDSWKEGQPLPTDHVRLIGHTLNHYDGPPYVGRPAGSSNLSPSVGPYGALTRSESLVLTEAELEAAYSLRRPTYLGGSAALPAGAPAGFGQQLGYRLEADSPAGFHQGYYADTQRRQFDFQLADPVDELQPAAPAQRRGIVAAVEDALLHRSTIEPDAYWLQPAKVVDVMGLQTSAAYNYRVLLPSKVTDPNGNETHFSYTPLGLLGTQFLRGRDGEGGTETKPEVKYLYDFRAFERTRPWPWPQPLSVHTCRRIWHAKDTVSDETIETRDYSDGFGRVIQTRAQAEELTFGPTGDAVGLLPTPGGVSGPAEGQRVADRVTVSGWQVYDNKGRVIEKYEPFFATGWEYQQDSQARQGQHATLYYDPRGQLTRTVNPDGSEQRVIYGIPADLVDPDTFWPTPWETYVYDPNDLSPLSRRPDGQSLAGAAPSSHHFTPASAVVDGLGRVVCQVQRSGSVPAQDWFVTRSCFDLRGNVLEITDPLGRSAFRHAYDLQNRPLLVESIDAGARTSVLDVLGNLVEYRDSKGSLALRHYDALGRLTHLWARNETSAPVTLRERLEYGDGGTRTQPAADRQANRAVNRLGRLARHYDEAGLLEFQRYDFKGNLIEKTRRVIVDAAIGNGWIANWSAAGSESALDTIPYQTNSRYDALNRVVEIIYPRQVAGTLGQRAVLRPHYNRAGALERVELDGRPYVTQVAYNAKEQRVLIAYGNGVMTRYAYDSRTFRLVRLRSEPYRHPPSSPDTWQGVGTPLQELTYSYDLVGNITAIEERTPGCGVRNNPQLSRFQTTDPVLRQLLAQGDALVREFGYDPLYCLIWATGRACNDIGSHRPIQDSAPCPSPPDQHNAPHLSAPYTETYTYDPAGNLLKLRYLDHTSAGRNWQRAFGFANLPPEQWSSAGSNRLTSLQQGSTTYRYEYDDNGNLRRQNTERYYTWDHADRMIGFTCQPCNSEHPSVEARYLYGADGSRVKKWVRTNGTSSGESIVYIDGLFEHHGWEESGAPKQNNVLHVMDNQSRIALRRSGDVRHQDPGPEVQYHLGDHLGSSSLLLSGDGSWVNREEYFPFGETSFGSFSRKRYRFTGKERDEESGLAYHGARYYAPWISRWIACDPLGPMDGANAYTP